MTGRSRRFFQAVAVTTALAVLTGTAHGATIQVTTTAQGVADDGECSLQEAIYSANFDFGVAPSSFIPLEMFDTGCNTGSGADVIELQAGQVYQMTFILDDPYNPLGSTATPIVLSDITIEANGAQLLGLNTRRRAFAVARRGLADPDGDLPIAGDGIGMLTIQNAHIKGFTVKGGDGASGGGGGLGAGGAIYVRGGALTVESCTFEGNGATGGNGSAGHSGGGGGLGGNGGQRGGGSAFFGGGGGGGSRGNGGNGGFDNNCPGSGCEGGGGGGGGTVSSGQDAPGGTASGDGGAACGGDGGSGGNIFFAEGGDLGCAGGGGGGGSSRRHGGPVSGDGGGGGYGGGGGGGGYEGGDGGHGGFGGGGGAGGFSDFGDAGDGDFGGGGGANGSSGDRGQGGTFAGDGSGEAGGGGAGLGGAIFNDLGTVIILNSTFTANFVVPGVAGGTGASSGQGAGGALFSVDGSLTVLNSTISGNESTGEAGEGGGIVFYSSTRDTSGSLTIRNTIIANNGVRECFYTGDLDQLTTNGSGNLIVQNFGCPGMESMDDPMLGPLQINAPGVTPTMAITDTSPAFDTGDDSNGNCQPRDQRGVARPQSLHCDIGAYEVGNRPPVANCKDVTVSADSNCMAEASIDDGSFDPDTGDTFTLDQSPPGPYGVGTTTVTLTVTDEEGASGSCTGEVTVVDNVPPVISSSLQTSTLSPTRNHDLVNVGLGATATDDCSAAPTTLQVRVFGDEDDPMPTDGSIVFSPDASDIRVGALRLRAERADSSNGRVYLIVVSGTDGSGNNAIACSAVVVPHDTSAGSLASANAQASAAKAYCQAHGGAAPLGYFVIGDGPVIGSKKKQ